MHKQPIKIQKFLDCEFKYMTSVIGWDMGMTAVRDFFAIGGFFVGRWDND